MSAVDVLAVRAAEILAEKYSDGTRIGRELLAVRIARLEQRDAAMAELVAIAHESAKQLAVTGNSAHAIALRAALARCKGEAKQ